MVGVTEENHRYSTFAEVLMANIDKSPNQPILKFVNRSGSPLNQSNNQSECETVTFKDLERLIFGQAAYYGEKLKDVKQAGKPVTQSVETESKDAVIEAMAHSVDQSQNPSVNSLSSNQKFVAILSSSGIEYFLSLLGLVLINTVPVLCSTRNNRTINQHLIEQSQCVAIVHSAEFAAQAKEIKAAMESNNQSIVLIEMPVMEQAFKVQADDAAMQSIKQSIKEVADEVRAAEKAKKPSVNQWCLCLHTSGTTGLYPRLIRLNHSWALEIWRGDQQLRDIEHQMIEKLNKQSGQTVKYQSDQVMRYILSPLFHAAGVIGSFAALMRGECIGLYNQTVGSSSDKGAKQTVAQWPPTPETALHELVSVKATALETVPFLLEQVVEYLHDQEHGLSSEQAVGFSVQNEGDKPHGHEIHQSVKELHNQPKQESKCHEGWRILVNLDRVNYGGAACPPFVAHALLEHGVNVVGYYGSTECGLITRGYQCRALNQVDKQSNKENTHWQTMRFLPNVRYKFINRFDDNSSKELVVLKDSPNRAIGQSNTPEGDWRTGDQFQQDPDDPLLFTVTGRIDDLIIHVTGEKTSPGPIENGVMTGAENVVERACVVGQKRFSNCLLVEVKQEARRTMSDQAILQTVWQALQAVNSTIPRHSVIPERMIGLLPEGSKIPVSDKGSIKRKLVDQSFGDFIENLYAHFSDMDLSKVVLTDWKSEQQIMDWLNKTAGEILEESKIDNDASLFSQGLDSLTAVSLQKTIAEHFSTVKNLPENLVYQATSISKLSKFLFSAFSSKEFHAQTNWLEVSEKLFEKYSSRDLIKSCASDLENVIRAHSHNVDVQSEETKGSPTNKRVYLITGATGSLGNFILAELLQDSSTSKVYCAVRGNATDSWDDMFNKLAHAWSHRGFDAGMLMKAHGEKRLVTFPCQLSDATYKLGASDEFYSELATNVTHIIHGAWKMDFNSMITEFEQSCIRPSFALLLLSGLGKRKHFTFISSISSCLAYPAGQDVPEEIHDRPQWAHSMGYGQSKLCVERLTRVFHSMGMCNMAEVIRVGQIMGDTVHGRWNTAEHLPLLMKAGQLMHKMPAHYFGDLIDWVPVDCIARAIHELILAPEKNEVGVSNLVNPQTIQWPQFLDVLRQCGFKFDVVPGDEWAKELAKGDVNTNPAVKLAHFFEQGMAPLESEARAGDKPVEGVHPVKFSTTKTAERSAAIKELPPVNAQWMQTCIQSWQQQGFLSK